MSGRSFHVLATAAVLITANAIQASAQAIPNQASSKSTMIIQGEFTGVCTTGEAAEASPGSSLSQTPIYIELPQGLKSYSGNKLRPDQNCDQDVCTANVILGYCLPGFDSAELEFRLCGVPQDTRVTVGLLNFHSTDGDPYDFFRTACERTVEDDLLCRSTELPVASRVYNSNGWVEILIGLTWLSGAVGEVVQCPANEFLGDTVSIREVTLGPPA